MGVCDALLDNKEKVKVNINTFLNSLGPANEELQLDKLKTYLLDQECISQVAISDTYLRTSPPIRQLFITTSDKLQDEITLNISVGKSKLQVENIIRNQGL